MWYLRNLMDYYFTYDNHQIRSVAQSCPTLCDPRNCSLPGSSVHGIFQARVLEWGAIAFSITDSSVLKSYITDYFIFLCSCIFLIYVPLRTYVHASVHAKLLSHVQLCSLTDYSSTGPSVHGISRQEYWSELPWPPPEDLPHPGIRPASPALPVDSLPLSHQGSHLIIIKLSSI